MKYWMIVGLFSIAAALASCTAESNSAAKVPHQPLTPDKVSFYRAPPAKYDTIGLLQVPVTPELHWDERGDASAGFRIFRSKAAAMGANGVLLMLPDNQFDRQVTAGYNGEYYTVALKGQPGHATALAQAIYVYNP